MRDLDKMLEWLEGNEDYILSNQEDLTELEKRRILNMTMSKIRTFEGEKGMKERRKEHKKKMRSVSKNGIKVAVGIGAVLLVGTGAYAAFRLNPDIRNAFRIYEKEQREVAKDLIDTPMVSDKVGDVKITVSQVIGDNNGFYAVMQAKGIPETANVWSFKDSDVKIKGISQKQSIGWTDVTQGAVEDGVTNFTVKVKSKDVNGKNISLSLKNLGYENENGKFVTKVKGQWNFSWKLRYEDLSKTYKVKKEVPMRDIKASWEKFVLSPLSVTVYYKEIGKGQEHFSPKEWEKYDGKDRIVVEFTDGSRIDSRFSEACDTFYYLGNDSATLEFGKVVLRKEIASISFAGERYELCDTKNDVERIKYVSKGANCTVELPKQLGAVVTLEEVENEKNEMLNCKEHYTIFWGEKNGCKMPMFSIHRYKGMHSVEELEENEPMKDYIGYRGGYTYAISYGEFYDEAQMENFETIMNDYIENVLPFFEYLN